MCRNLKQNEYPVTMYISTQLKKVLMKPSIIPSCTYLHLLLNGLIKKYNIEHFEWWECELF